MSDTSYSRSDFTSISLGFLSSVHEKIHHFQRPPPHHGATVLDSTSNTSANPPLLVTHESTIPNSISGATVPPQSSSEVTGTDGTDEILLPAAYSTETISFLTFVTQTISGTINSRISTETTIYELVMITSSSNSQIVIGTLATLATEFSSGNENTPILTEPGPSPTVTSNSSSASNTASSTNETSHHSAVIGIGAGVPLVVLSLTILVYLLWRYKRNIQAQSVEQPRFDRSPYEKPEMEDTGKARMEMDISGIHELEAPANPQSSHLAELEATHGSSELLGQAAAITRASSSFPPSAGKDSRTTIGTKKDRA
ncbi:MAG: hypothetical protein M1820_009750 [Bogoriella megaspora]|nr:MAG: hypothetical protein M1820_009750 [Bogoriella megaspora]